MTSGIFHVLVCFVRQWLHDHASLTESLSGPFSPYSALSLVRQRIHALHQSTELFEEAHIFPREGDSGHRIQRYAWFNSGYKFMRQTAEAGFASDLTPRAVLFFPLVRPMMRCIMAGMNQKDSCPRSSSSSLSWCGGRSPMVL